MNKIVIVFEGIDGVGKSTQAEMLKNKIRKFGVDVKLLHFPSSGVIGKEVHKLLKNGKFEKLPPRSRVLLTASDFFNVFDELEHFNGVLIFDRYWHSSIVSNCEEQDVTEEWVLSLHTSAPSPDLVIFLDCDPSEILKRKEADFGAKDVERQKRIRKNYIEMFTRFECMKINALNQKNQIANKIWGDIEKLIK